MKKRAVLFYALSFFIIPTALVSIFTAISSLASVNYEYLPESLDFLITVFYDLAALAAMLASFFSLGASYIALAKKRLAALAPICAAIYNAVLLPLLQFPVRTLVFGNAVDISILQEYWTEDIYSSMTGAVKIFLGALVVALTALFFKLTKRKDIFERPFIAGRGVITLSSAIIAVSLMILASLMFTLGGEYASYNILSLIMELAADIMIYFASVFGAYTEHTHIITTENC